MSIGILIVENAARWTKNILVEVVHNHGKDLTSERADHLRAAIACLSAFDMAEREEKHPDFKA